MHLLQMDNKCDFLTQAARHRGREKQEGGGVFFPQGHVFQSLSSGMNLLVIVLTGKKKKNGWGGLAVGCDLIHRQVVSMFSCCNNSMHTIVDKLSTCKKTLMASRYLQTW